MSSRTTQTVKAVACLLFAAVALAAPVGDKKRETTLDGMRRALDQTTNLEFNNVPLQDALTQLGEQTKLNIVLDRASAMQLGQDPSEMNVTVRLKDVKLKTGLRNLLCQYNLTYVVLGDAILVSTEDNATSRLLRQPVDIEVDNQPLAEVIKRLGRTTGVNVVIDPRQAKVAQTVVTLKLDDVPLETGVRLLAELAGLKPARMGNVLFITTEDRADRLRDEGGMQPPPMPAVEHIMRNINAAGGPGGNGGAVPVPVVPPAAPPPNNPPVAR
ncbi:MAG: hypothetical protein U0746_00790 [Gemmataceae bacterium]